LEKQNVPVSQIPLNGCPCGTCRGDAGLPAGATFRLRIEDTTNHVGAVITDGGALDTGLGLGTPGLITFSGTVGFFSINVTTGVSSPQVGGVYNLAEMDLHNVSIVWAGSGSANLLITLEDTGFSNATAGVNYNLLGSIGGTITGGADTVNVNSWVNTSALAPNLGQTRMLAGLVPLARSQGERPGLDSNFSYSPEGAFSGDSANTFVATSSNYSLFTQFPLASRALGRSVSTIMFKS